MRQVYVESGKIPIYPKMAGVLKLNINSSRYLLQILPMIFMQTNDEGEDSKMKLIVYNFSLLRGHLELKIYIFFLL